MSDSIICPVCDTPNDPGTDFCEACGERLDEESEALVEANFGDAPASDDLAGSTDAGDDSTSDEAPEAEESGDADADDFADEESAEEQGDESSNASEEDADSPDADSADELAEDQSGEDDESDLAVEADADFEDGSDSLESGTDASEAEDDFGDVQSEAGDEGTAAEVGDEGTAPEVGDEGTAAEADETPAELSDEGTAAADDFRATLYSPVDGQAYYEGSAEFEEGFGPHGEELVPDPPEGLADDSVVDEPPQPERAEMPLGAGASEAFAAAFQAREPKRPSMEPLPTPGTLTEPATLTLYVNREPVASHAVDTDETLIGRRDPVSDSYPDFDLSEFDAQALVSRKHAYVYRQNRNYTLYVVSHAGTQLNSELLALGDRRSLKDGDVVVIAGMYALKFDAGA